MVYVGTTVAYGTWVFKYGGTGTYSFTNYATILPGGDPSIPVEVRVFERNDIPFTFVITPFGDITVTTCGINLIGSISVDKKNMTLLSANGDLARDRQR
jgi:hypothetical protein